MIECFGGQRMGKGNGRGWSCHGRKRSPVARVVKYLAEGELVRRIAGALHHACRRHYGVGMHLCLGSRQRRTQFHHECHRFGNRIALPRRRNTGVPTSGDSHEGKLREPCVSSAHSPFESRSWRDHVEVLVVPDAQYWSNLSHELHHGFGLRLGRRAGARVLPVSGRTLPSPSVRKVSVEVYFVGVPARLGGGAVGIHVGYDPQLNTARRRHCREEVGNE